MDLVDQGLGRNRGDLRVAVHWVARAGTVFLGAIIFTDGSKSKKKKNAHKKKQEMKGIIKCLSRVFIEAWNMSRFATAKGEAWFAVAKAWPHSGEASFAVADQKVWS